MMTTEITNTNLNRIKNTLKSPSNQIRTKVLIEKSTNKDTKITTQILIMKFQTTSMATTPAIPIVTAKKICFTTSEILTIIKKSASRSTNKIIKN